MQMRRARLVNVPTCSGAALVPATFITRRCVDQEPEHGSECRALVSRSLPRQLAFLNCKMTGATVIYPVSATDI